MCTNLLIFPFLLPSLFYYPCHSLKIIQSSNKTVRAFLSKNIQSVSNSRCTPHLVYSPSTIHEFEDLLLQSNIPVQITYIKNFHSHQKWKPYQIDEARLHTKTLNNHQTKFIKPTQRKIFSENVTVKKLL